MCNKASDIVFLALHPAAMMEGVRGIGQKLPSRAIVVSLAPKIPAKTISEMLCGFDRIARMIPNSASIVAKGFNQVSFSSALGQEDRKALGELFSLFGACPLVEEEKLDAYAVLTAMGPTYFNFQIEEIMQIAAGFGLEGKEIRTATKAMLEGMTATLFDSGLTLDSVIDLIPGKPMSQNEAAIREMYRGALNGIYRKLKA